MASQSNDGQATLTLSSELQDHLQSWGSFVAKELHPLDLALVLSLPCSIGRTHSLSLSISTRLELTCHHPTRLKLSCHSPLAFHRHWLAWNY